MIARDQHAGGMQVRDTALAKTNRIPSRGSAVLFSLKTFVLRLKRTLSELPSARQVRPQTGQALTDGPLLASSKTPLWTAAGDQALVQGKVQNLRQALRRVNGLEIAGGQVFSFWRQVGRPTRLRGFVKGRELRQGCMIASTGGGLCQLSNALYECALNAGFDIVERHAHSKVVPGSRAEVDLDATVFWNYVDLRFASASRFRIEALLTADSLVIQFRGEAADASVNEYGGRATTASLTVLSPGRAIKSLPIQSALPHNCAECGITSCFRSERNDTVTGGRTAFLLDAYSPEFDDYVQSVRTAEALLALPINGQKLRRKNYGWTTRGFGTIRTAPATTLRRSLLMRNLPAQGSSLQIALMKGDAMLARRFARMLTPDITHVVLPQNLLVPLWKSGHLGGRTFDILMTRLPIRELERTLDFAQRLHPESRTLSDFRADRDVVTAEAEALASARFIVTASAQISNLFGPRAVSLNWQLPQESGNAGQSGTTRRTRGAILFPASTLGRKGAYELRAAARKLNLEVVLMGPVLEDPDFWQGIRVRQAGPDWLEGITAVCLPSFAGQHPRRLLAAIARGVPVITTEACGLGCINDGVILVPPGDSSALTAAIWRILAENSAVLESECVA